MQSCFTQIEIRAVLPGRNLLVPIVFFVLFLTSINSVSIETGQAAISATGSNPDIYISDPQLIYEDSKLPFSIDGSFATLKKSGTEQYYWHSFGNVNYKYHGPLYDPLQNKDWEKSDFELFNPNGKADLFTDRIFINNIYKGNNGDLLGFSHIEKYDFSNPGHVKFAIGLIYSTDNGDSWLYCGEIIRPQEDTDNIGGVPYLVAGEYFHVYYNEKPVGLNRRISVARAKIDEVLTAASIGNVTSWKKYSNGTWTQDGLTGVGSNLIPDVTNWHDVHSDASFNRTTGKYMLTVQTHNYGQLLLYTSTDGINWSDRMVVDETADNNFIQAYSFFVGLDDSSEDSHEVGNEFYIFYPRKDWPGNYAYDELYRRLVSIGYKKNPPPLPTMNKYIFSADFSTIQGKHSWYYQFWSENTYADMFQDYSNDRWEGNEPYVLIGSGWLHPGNSSDAALKWVAPENGALTINGTVAHIQQGCPEADGVTVKIFHNDNEIWTHILGLQDSITHNLSFDVISGDAIYFIVKKGSNNSCDTTDWDPTISLCFTLPGDIDMDGSVSLKDALLSLRVSCDQNINTKDVSLGADVNGDNKISLKEVIFILQSVAELR